MIGTDNSIGDYKETTQIQGINDAFVLRFKNKPKKLPLFKYNLLATELPEKKISINPSLLKSATPTPCPLYKYSYLKTCKESSSRIVLVNFTPVL